MITRADINCGEYNLKKLSHRPLNYTHLYSGPSEKLRASYSFFGGGGEIRDLAKRAEEGYLNWNRIFALFFSKVRRHNIDWVGTRHI